MNYTVGTRHQLNIVAKEAASRKSDTRIERDVADCFLFRECFPAISRLPDEVFHLGVERVVAVVIPTYVDVSIGSGCGPGEEVVLAIAKRIVIDAIDGGLPTAGVHDGHVDAWRGLEFPTFDLIGREGTVGGVAVNPATRGLGAGPAETPIGVVDPEEEGKRGNGVGVHHPVSTDQHGLIHVHHGVGEVVEENVRSATAVDDHVRELRVGEMSADKGRRREGQSGTRGMGLHDHRRALGDFFGAAVDAEVRSGEVAKQRVVDVRGAVGGRAGIVRGDERLIQSGVASEGWPDELAVAWLVVNGGREQVRIRPARKTLSQFDLGVEVLVVVDEIEDHIACDRGEVAVVRAVERYTRITLKCARKETRGGNAAPHHGVIRPGLAAIGGSVEELVVPVLAEVIGHDHVVVSVSGVNRPRPPLWARDSDLDLPDRF
jgi:hypothetical protein